jgi:glycosyltransferase involved in cell wall biosynthesis
VPAQVWVVVPAYNEGSRLSRTLTELLKWAANVVVVDDGSADDTLQYARQHPVWCLRHIINRGQGAALQTGIDFAVQRGAEIIVTFDADGQHDPAEMSRLIAPVLAGSADVALGSRFLGAAIGIPWTRKLLLRVAVVFTRVLSRIKVTDTHNGYRALSRAAARTVRMRQDRMAHASEILDLIRIHGLRFVEVPVTIRYSAATLAKGQSSWDALRVAAQFLIGKVVR